MIFDRLFRWRNSLRAADIVGNVVVGANKGFIWQVYGGGRPPLPPSLPWRSDLPTSGDQFPIFNLLTWQCRLTPELIGRKTEQRELLEWAHSSNGPTLRVRFVVGPAGVGKTRLAAEVAEGLRNQRWCAGFADLGKETSLPCSRKGLFLIVENPEASREPVHKLLSEAAKFDLPSAPIRILLLSRQPFDAWKRDIRKCGATNLFDTQPIEVGPLEVGAAKALFHVVVERLTKHCNLPLPPPLNDIAVETWLKQAPDINSLPLFTTAAAIKFVDQPGDELGFEAKNVFRAIVDRERTLVDDVHGLGRDTGSRLFGLAALRNGLDEKTVRRLAAPELEFGLPKSDQVVDVIRGLGWWHEDKLSAPVPDIVAAEFLRQVLRDNQDHRTEWVWATLSDPASVQIELLDRRVHDMMMLGEDHLVECLIGAVDGRAERAEVWREFLDPKEPCFRLGSVGIAVARALLLKSDLSDEQRGDIHRNLASRLSDVGEYHAGLEEIKKAVKIYHQLPVEDLARLTPDLALNLNDLSNHLSNNGYSDEALQAIKEAVAISGRLMKTDPPQFESLVALILNNLSLRLTDIGDRKGAIVAIREAVEIRRRLARQDAARVDDLALSLTNLSAALGDEDPTGARDAITEAANIYRNLAQRGAGVFAPVYAGSLNNLSVFLDRTGDNVGALKAIREAVAIHQQLARENPMRFTPDFAMSLHNLALRLTNTGNHVVALEANGEAVELYGQLVRDYPMRYSAEFASSQRVRQMILMLMEVDVRPDR